VVPIGTSFLVILRHVHDRARAALSILKISEIEEILVPSAAKLAQATIKPYYLEREIFVKRFVSADI
jgi:hypothetical protein